MFIATIAAAIFGGIQLWPAFASLYKTESSPAPSNTAIAPGGIAIAGGVIGALPTNSGPSAQITINNSDPAALDVLKREIIGREQQRQAALSLEAKLADAEQSLRSWQFWYFRSAHPLSVEMLRDLAALQNYAVRKDVFDARWSNTIKAPETRSLYINDVLLRYGWAVEQNGLLRITEGALTLLRQSGLYIAPYAVEHTVLPSFNCGKADQWYEKLICSDQELAGLDIEMVRLFKQLQSRSGADVQTIKISQADWRKKVRNLCLDRNCLIDSYNERIKQLRSAGAL
ncbi:lysozyme inhibitor LprI family protein [Vogesella facilis]|uniref:Lysozyme inhibitor LprI family protein n=1 Tax=Vogesella facilis TaxID=1655232 RepID=A0ABV7RE46_9NEIS